jgi:hypothetical protein
VMRVHLHVGIVESFEVVHSHDQIDLGLSHFGLVLGAYGEKDVPFRSGGIGRCDCPRRRT